MKQMLEFIGYGFPVIGATTLVIKFGNAIPEKFISPSSILASIILLYSIYWLKKVEQKWIEKLFMMFSLSTITFFAFGDNIGMFMIFVISVATIIGISALYIKYKIMFQSNNEYKNVIKYYPEEFSIKDYRKIFISFPSDLQDKILSIKNTDIDLRSFASHFRIPLKDVLAFIKKLENEGKVIVKIHDGKVFLRGDKK